MNGVQPPTNIFSGMWNDARFAFNEPENLRVVTGFWWPQTLMVMWAGLGDSYFSVERLSLNALTRDDAYFTTELGFDSRPVGAWWLMPSDRNEPPGIFYENCTLRGSTYEVGPDGSVERWQCIFPVGFRNEDDRPQADVMPIIGEFPWELLTNSN